MTLPIPVPPHFRIIAHRGASAYAPENTAAAFALAQAMGVHEIELDTQLTRDGRVVLCHDATLARFGHGPRPVEALRWDELAGLDMGSWFSPHLFAGEPMLTLDALLARFGAAFTYHVELKGRAPGLARAVHTVIEQSGLRARCIVTSFHYDALVAMRQVDAQLPLGWLVQEVDDAALAGAVALGLVQLCPRADRVIAAQVEHARATVAEVRAWGLQGERVYDQAATVQALIRRVLDAGCDGMTINWPDWVRHTRGEETQDAD